MYFLPQIIAATNPPVLLNQKILDHSKNKNLLLVYYANETSPTTAELKNYEVLSKWIQESNSDKNIKNAERWRKDISKFPPIVDGEIRKIQYGVKKQNKISAVIVNNRLARKNILEIYDHRDKNPTWKRTHFSFPNFENYIQSSNVLANIETLRSVLSLLETKFPPESFVYLLHIKSHGGEDYALTVNVSKRHEDLNKKDFIHALRNPKPIQKFEQLGIKKTDFFETIANSKGLYTFIFLESCRSGIKLIKSPSELNNVGLLSTSDHRGIRYSNINFDKLSFDSSLVNQYYQQIAKIAKDEHKSEYGINLDIPLTIPL